MSTADSSKDATRHDRSASRRTLGEWLTIDGISYIPSTVLLTGIAKTALKDNNLFAVLDLKGESPGIYHAELGFYFCDTRHLSNWEMTVNGEKLVYLSHDLRGQGNSCLYSMTNRDIPSLDGVSRIARDTLLIRRILTFHRDEVFEHLEFINYDIVPHELEIEQVARSHFDDIFEVRGMHRPERGVLAGPRRDETSGGAVMEYHGRDGRLRSTHLTPVGCAEPDYDFQSDGVTLKHRLALAPKARVDLKTMITFNAPPSGCMDEDVFAEMAMTDHMMKVESLGANAFLGELRIASSDPIFERAMKNARLDVEMLTTFEAADNEVYPYAGIPWFSAPFGRDGIITAYQMMPWYPDLARGVLNYIFRHIGTKVDPFTDEEPGKIFHELRRGEMAQLKEIPYIPYYGSVDSTPLGLILLGEYFKWTGDMERLRQWWPTALRCVEWMDKWGDSDGDGFIEYMKGAGTGLDNQGWKDSYNSVMYHDGRLAQPPIKLCEVQAYAYRARRSMADLASTLGDAALARKLTDRAEELRRRFIASFWDPSDRYIYLARDGLGQACRVMSSNQGHCLWGGVLSPDEAASVTQHLLSPRLFSGHGIRTLAADERAYNPLSYHNGSVWPHDNSLIAEGLRDYGHLPQLQKLTDALYDVVATSADFRLPELYCGFRRRDMEPPVPYEVACKPQAWAAGSLFLLLKSLLGLNLVKEGPDGQKTIVLRSPMLPTRVTSLEIEGMRIQDTVFSARIVRNGREGRDGKSCQVEVMRHEGTIQIVVEK